MSAKFAVITGANSGFGYGLTTRLFKEGWTVVAAMRQVDKRRQQFSELIAQDASRIILVECDVTSKSDREQLIKQINQSSSDRLDLLVNNAGGGFFGAAEDLKTADFSRLFETNVFSAVDLTSKLLPNLRRAKGKVLAVSSVFGMSGFPFNSAYCASKFAINGYFESLAMEVKPFGVSVSIIEPGGHKTNFLKSASWVSSSSQVYQKQIVGFKNTQAKVSARGGRSPEKAVEQMMNLIKKKNPPLYTSCGGDALGMRFLRHFLGRNRFVSILGAMTSRVFSKNS